MFLKIQFKKKNSFLNKKNQISNVFSNLENSIYFKNRKPGYEEDLLFIIS